MTSVTLKKFGIPALILAVLSLSTGGMLYTTKMFEEGQLKLTIPSEARMLAIGVGVYWDITCTGPVIKIDWGSLSPGEIKSVIVYIKNTGNGPMTCSIASDNWNPSGANQYFDLYWDFGMSTLDAGRIRKTMISLHVHSDISGITNFSFNIIITGTG